MKILMGFFLRKSKKNMVFKVQTEKTPQVKPQKTPYAEFE